MTRKSKNRKRNKAAPAPTPASSSSQSKPSNDTTPIPLDKSSSTALPFPFEEAISNPALYREMVTPAIWEEFVNLPKMKEMYNVDTSVPFDADGRGSRAALEEDPWFNFFSQGRTISRMHQRVSDMILSRQGWNFERRWKAFSSEERSNEILLALNSTFRKLGPPGAILRWWCPDITVESMVEREGFLPLVRYIARSGRIHKGKDYDPVICPDFDRTNGTIRGQNSPEGIPFDRAARHMQLVTEQSRDYFISLFVMLILFNHFDTKQLFPNGFDSLLAIAHDKPRLEVEEAKDWMLAGHLDTRDKEYMYELQEACGITDRQEEMHRIVDGLHKEKEARWGCETCYRYPEQVEEMVKSGKKKLLWCSGCLKIGRKIGYCGEDCRNLDWRDGHKTMCGRPFHQIEFRHGQLPPSPKPPLSLPVEWHLYHTETGLPQDLKVPRSYVFRRQVETRSINEKSSVSSFEVARTTEITTPSVHSLLLAAIHTREKSYIKLFATYAAICCECPFEFDEPWKQAVALQASEEWDLDYEEVYEWLAKDEVDKTERIWKEGRIQYK